MKGHPFHRPTAAVNAVPRLDVENEKEGTDKSVGKDVHTAPDKAAADAEDAVAVDPHCVDRYETEPLGEGKAAAVVSVVLCRSPSMQAS